MRILYDSKKSEFKHPFGCLKQNEECTINIKIPVSCKTKEVFIIFKNEISLNEYRFSLKKIFSDSDYEKYSLKFSTPA